MENPYAPPTQDPSAAASSLTGGAAGGPVPWTISEVLGVGFNAVKARPVELVGGFFLVLLLSQLPGVIPLLLAGSGIVGEGSALHLALQGVVLLASLVIGPFFWVGQIRVALAAARQESFDFGLFFSGADRLLPMIGVTILSYLGISMGLLLLIVPGILVAIGWSLAGPLIVDASDSPLEALSESWEATKGHKLQLFLLGLCGLGLMLVGLCACYVGIFVVLPALVVAYMEAYRRITGRMSGASAGASSSAQTAWMTPPRIPL
jgi:hypothetical protein